MNRLSRKLHELEDNVLDFPPNDKEIVLAIIDKDEQLLHDRANRLRESLKDDAQAIIDSSASVEQQNEAAKLLLSRLSDEELQTYFDGDVEEVEYHETFEVVVSCKDEAEQETVYNKLRRDGYKCRVLTL